MGFLIGATIFILLFSYADKFHPWIIRKAGLLPGIFMNSIAYVLIIFLIASLYIFIFNLKHLDYLFNNFRIIFFSQLMLYGVFFGLILSLFMNFLFLINNLLGRNALHNFFMGKYVIPVREYRFFMFLDIKESTSIAENIGELNFLSLLNNFFFDMSEAIISTKGEIYKYVGDEAIITWGKEAGIKDSNCIRLFFLFKEKLEKLEEKYKSLFGVVPAFKAGLHFGPVVVGEMGYIKKELAYMGDVLNTTARIEGECNIHGIDFIISGDVSNIVKIPLELKINDLGLKKLRGKEEETRLFGITGELAR